MQEKEFQSKYLKKVRETLKFALENKFSDFYRKKYAGLNLKPENIKTYADFQKIPFLTKDEILAVALEERNFVPKTQIIAFSRSSGTTNHKNPLILPHSKSEGSNEIIRSFDEILFKRLGIKKVLGLMPENSVIQDISNFSYRKTPLFPADPNDMKLAAKMMLELDIDGILTTSTILLFFSEELARIKFDFTKVKYISLGSEFNTKQRIDYFRALFPKAYFKIRYGNSEINTYLGYRCDFLENANPNIFHPHEIHLTEIADENGKVTDHIGEIIHTGLNRRAFPMIRYRTGDFGQIKKEYCACGDSNFLYLGGRKETDRVKISGAIFHTQAIADAITAAGLTSNWFQCQISEDRRSETPKLNVELNIFYPEKKPSEISAEKISQNWFLSANKTYPFFVQKGLLNPLSVKYITKFPKSTKTKNILLRLD